MNEEGFLTDEEFDFWLRWEMEDREERTTTFFARVDKVLAEAEALLASYKGQTPPLDTTKSVVTL